MSKPSCYKMTGIAEQIKTPAIIADVYLSLYY